MLAVAVADQLAAVGGHNFNEAQEIGAVADAMADGGNLVAGLEGVFVPVPAMRLGLGPPEIVLTAEEPTPEWTQKLGQAPPIYSAEINYWLMRAALDILKNRPDIRVLYVHTTDYPMHMWERRA